MVGHEAAPTLFDLDEITPDACHYLATDLRVEDEFGTYQLRRFSSIPSGPVSEVSETILRHGNDLNTALTGKDGHGFMAVGSELLNAINNAIITSSALASLGEARLSQSFAKLQLEVEARYTQMCSDHVRGLDAIVGKSDVPLFVGIGEINQPQPFAIAKIKGFVAMRDERGIYHPVPVIEDQGGNDGKLSPKYEVSGLFYLEEK